MAKKRNKEAHNALLRQYIKEIENPDRHGFIGGKWVQSPYKDDDPNNRGYGVDVFYNKAAAKLTEGRPERWLTEDEERMLRNKHIKEVNKAAKDHYFPYLRRTPLSEEKEIMATGLLYRGDHINGTKLADPYYNGSNTDFQKAVEDYYRSKNLNDRAWRSKEFMDTHKVVDSPAPISLESPYVPMEYVGYHPNEGYYYAGELPQAEVFGEHKHAEGGMLYGNEGNMPNTPQEEYQDDYQSDDTVPQETPRQWDELSLSEKNAFIASAVKHGITNMEDIKNAYNELSQGQMDAAPEEEEEGNKFLKGGYKPSRNIKNYIANKEGASMKTNRSFEEEAQSFWSVLPKDVRSKLTQEQADALYSYSYNVGAGNFKHRVVPALQRYFSGNGSMEDVQRHMYATKDSQLRGLANRRAEERAMFAGSKVPVYYDTPNDTPTANMSSAWRSSRLGPVTSIDMSRGLGVVNNNSLNSNVLLGPISNMRQDYPMMSEASNTLYDDDKPTLMEAPQEGSSLDRYNAIQDYLSSLGSFGYARGGRMYDKGGVTSSNGQYHVEPSEYSGVLSNVSNGNPLEVTLPDTTVTANDPRNYRSYYDPSGAGEFMDATTLGLFPNPFNLSRSASTFMQKPSWDSAWDTTKDALMFAGSAGKEAAFAPLGLMNLVDKDGVRKTYSLAKEGNYAGAAMSGLGDALNVGMAVGPTVPLLTNIRDYNNIKDFTERYGYNEYKPKIGLIFNDSKLDRLTEQLVKQHNRFTRGVSVSEARKYYGFPKDWTDEQIAEYCLTHSHIPSKLNSGGNPEGKPVLYTSNSIDLAKQYTDGNGFIGILQRPIIYDSDRSKMLKMNDFRFNRLPKEINNDFNPSITTDEPYIVSRHTKAKLAKNNKVKGGLAYKHRGKVIRTYSPVSPTFLDAQANAGSYMHPTQLPYDKDFRHYLFYGEPENQLLGLEKLIRYDKPEGAPSVDYKPYSVGFSKKKALGGKL